MRERIGRADLRALVGKVVVYGDGVLDFEDYVEPGMRSRVVGVTFDPGRIDPEDVSHTIHVDYSEFDEFNRKFETTDFLDGDRKGLTAREAGYYKVKDRHFIGPYLDEVPFTVDEELTAKADAAMPVEMVVRNRAIQECVDIAMADGHKDLAEKLQALMAAVPQWVEEEDHEIDPAPAPDAEPAPAPRP